LSLLCFHFHAPVRCADRPRRPVGDSTRSEGPKTRCRFATSRRSCSCARRHWCSRAPRTPARCTL
jgi:hypothetical protein